MTHAITTIMIVGTVTIAAVGVTVILLAAGALVYGVGRAVWRAYRGRNGIAGRVLG